MSSTSAVAVLAQGLRDLRDFAEGPDPAELSRRTGLTGQQIDAALAGEQLPTREVTLALVAAWEGDVEAWRDYWGQIAELVQDDGAPQAEAGTSAVPVAPEPSIITPLPAQEPEEAHAEEAEDAGDAEPAQPSEPAEEHLGEPASAATETPQAPKVDQADEPQLAKADAAGLVAEVAEPDQPQPVGGQNQAAAGTAATAAASGDQQTASAAASAATTSASQPTASTPASTTAPAAAPAPADQRIATEPASATPAPILAATDPAPPSKRVVARAGIPALLFAVGVAVGAFGDHALRSSSASAQTAASLPQASQSHTSLPSTAPAAATSPTRGVSTSSAAVPGGPGSSSDSFTTSSSSQPSDSDSSAATSTSSTEGSQTSSSTMPPGTLLGSYTSIQLASSYSIDFFHDPYHPVSGTSNGPDSMGFFATSFVDGTFYADRVAILDPEETGSYAACLADTRYQKDVPLSKVSAGSAFCIHTSTGHLVLVTVKRMPSSTDSNPYAVVDVTVWQN